MLKLIISLALCAEPYFAATPTFSTVIATAASPNSALVSTTVTGGVSMQIQASTDTSYSIHTPWFLVVSSVTVGQLQVATAYNVRVVACDASMPAHPASAACSGNAGTSGAATVTTNGAIQSWPVNISLGSTVSYNAVQFPLNGRWADADTTYCTQMANGTIVCQGNDSVGPQSILTTGGTYTLGRSVPLTTVDAAFTNFVLLNPMGTGNGSNGFGAQRQGTGSTNPHNIPGCWSDNSSIKASSINADGNTLYHVAYRQEGEIPAYQQRFPWINRSDDGGATWYNSTHTSGSSSANGDPPCQADTLWSSTELALPRFVKQGGRGGAITNPVHGIDAYWYLHVRNETNTAVYLTRCFKQLNCQIGANWEYYGGASGGDSELPANWSTTSTAITSVWAPLGGSSPFYGDEDIQYLGFLGRFVLMAEIFLGPNDVRLSVWDSAGVTGFTLRYNEPTRPPFNVVNSQYLERAWNQIWMPTLTVTATNPPAASIQILSSGTSTQQFRSDPANNMYSPWLANATISSSYTMGLFALPSAIRQ